MQFVAQKNPLSDSGLTSMGDRPWEAVLPGLDINKLINDYITENNLNLPVAPVLSSGLSAAKRPEGSLGTYGSTVFEPQDALGKPVSRMR